MEPCLVTVVLSGSLREKVAVAARAGFTGLEIYDSDFSEYGRPAAEVRRIMADEGIRLVAYQPLREFDAQPESRRAEAMSRAERLLDLAAEIGADQVVVCANVSPDAVNDDSRAADDLAALGDRARPRNLRIAYEPMAWSTRVRDYAHAWSIVQRADHPNAGLTIDTFHTFQRANPLDRLEEIPGERIFLVQANDAPRLDLEIKEFARHHRSLPGEGVYPLGSFMRALAKTGFSGPLSLEIFNDALRGAPAIQTAAMCYRSYRWLVGQIEKR